MRRYLRIFNMHDMVFYGKEIRYLMRKKEDITFEHDLYGLIQRRSLVKRKFSPTYRKLPLPKTLKAEKEKGDGTEDAFFILTKALIKAGMLPWATRVRKSSRTQDNKGHFDFKIMAFIQGNPIIPFTIKIQVKSSSGNARRFKEKYSDKEDIYVVVITPSTMPQGLQETLDQIYMQEVDRLASLVDSAESFNMRI